MLVNMLSAGDQIRREVKMGYEIVYGRAQLLRVNKVCKVHETKPGRTLDMDAVRPGLF